MLDPETAVKSPPALDVALQATTLQALRATKAHDAIVVGAGAAGGLAAMLLAEAGLRVLVLDAGLRSRWWHGPVRRLSGKIARRLAAPDALGKLSPLVVPHARRAIRTVGRWRQPIQSHCYTWDQAPHAFVDDLDCPYSTPAHHPFHWIRSRALGGRLVVPGHGRQYYRLGPDDLAPPDGLSPPWPLRPGELDVWYDQVERRLGLSGMRDGLPWLPDSEITHLLKPTESEAALSEKIVDRWRGARPILGRYAPPLDALEAAARTGRLQCRQGAIVREIFVDDSGNVSGVSWIDHETGTEQQSTSSLIFLCASALESTRVLMLSRSGRNPEGLGGRSGVLGRYLMDHVIVGLDAIGPSLPGAVVSAHGRCLYLPRFDARELPAPRPGRGYGVQIYQIQAGGGRSFFIAFTFAEMLPRSENRVTLDPHLRDAWGVPALHIDCSSDEQQLALARDQTSALRDLADLAGAEIINLEKEPRPPGSAIHECGTARMGFDPSGSVLDSNNECWDARGLYVTDASCFPSQGAQNPTLTILALTARACHHAINRAGVTAEIAKA
jgi:choline dehydrogenase-like flavoprotein